MSRQDEGGHAGSVKRDPRSQSRLPPTPVSAGGGELAEPAEHGRPDAREKTALAHGLTPVSASRLTVVGLSVPLPNTGTTRSSAAKTSSRPHTSDA